MSRWVAALGCTPSHENASPNGLPAALAPQQLVAAVLGNGATCAGSARKAASATFGLRNAQSRAVARAAIAALYAATVEWRFASSVGSMLWSSVQSSVTVAPPRACAINPKPYWNGTSTVSPIPPED